MVNVQFMVLDKVTKDPIEGARVAIFMGQTKYTYASGLTDVFVLDSATEYVVYISKDTYENIVLGPITFWVSQTRTIEMIIAGPAPTTGDMNVYVSDSDTPHARIPGVTVEVEGLATLITDSEGKAGPFTVDVGTHYRLYYSHPDFQPDIQDTTPLSVPWTLSNEMNRKVVPPETVQVRFKVQDSVTGFWKSGVSCEVVGVGTEVTNVNGYSPFFTLEKDKTYTVNFSMAGYDPSTITKSWSTGYTQLASITPTAGPPPEPEMIKRWFRVGETVSGPWIANAMVNVEGLGNFTSGTDGYTTWVEVEKGKPYLVTVTASGYDSHSSTYTWNVEGTTIIALVTPPPVVPAMPANVTATAISTTAITVSWDAVPDAASYQIETGTGKLWTVTETSTNDTGLTPDTSYTYRVRACSGEGCGEWSAFVSATTLAEEPPPEPDAFNLKGVITSVGTGLPIQGASITAYYKTTFSDSAGNYMIPYPEGWSGPVNVTHADFEPAEKMISLVEGDTVLDFALVPLAEPPPEPDTVQVNVMAQSAETFVPIIGATVEVPGIGTKITGYDGLTDPFTLVKDAIYTFNVSALGYENSSSMQAFSFDSSYPVNLTPIAIPPPEPVYVLKGVVKSAETGLGILGAVVTAYYKTVITNMMGYYELTYDDGWSGPVDVIVDGFEPASKMISMTEGDNVLNFTLERIFKVTKGSVNITSTPSGARILFGAVDTAWTTPHTFYEEGGTKLVFFELDGYQTGEKYITWEDEVHKTEHVVLDPVAAPPIWQPFLDALAVLQQGFVAASVGLMNTIFRLWHGRDPEEADVIELTGLAASYWAPFQVFGKALYGVDLKTGEAASWEDVTPAELGKMIFDFAIGTLTVSMVAKIGSAVAAKIGLTKGALAINSAADVMVGNMAGQALYGSIAGQSMLALPAFKQTILAVATAMGLAAWGQWGAADNIAKSAEFAADQIVRSYLRGDITKEKALAELEKYNTFFDNMDDWVQANQALNPILWFLTPTFTESWNISRERLKGFEETIETAVPGVPSDVSTNIYNKREIITTKFFSIKDYIDVLIYADEVTVDQIAKANTMIDEMKADIDDLVAYLEENRIILENAGVFTIHTAWATAKDEAADNLRDTIPGIKEPDVPYPPALQDPIRILKDRIDAHYWNAKDFIRGEDMVAAAAEIAAGRAAIQEFLVLIEENRADLEGLGLYGPNLAWADAQKTKFDAVEALTIPPEEPPIVPPGQGTLKLYVSPPEVEVLAAGAVIGTTDETGYLETELDEGSAELTLQKEGYLTESVTAIIKPDRTTTIRKTLDPERPVRKLYKIDVSAQTPEGAELHPRIFINDVFTDKWAPDTIYLDAGRYEFRLKLSGYEDFVQVLDLEEEPLS